MGNGGQGVIIFGVAEDRTDKELPKAITPMTVRKKVGVLEDLVRDGVNPPLLMDAKEYSGPGGYILVVFVQRSPLGSYMVQGYGDFRYHKRVGTRTVPMREQEVNDLYSLAERAAGQQTLAWADHSMPVKGLSPVPWLCLSALPYEPLVDLLDLTTMSREEFAVLAEVAVMRPQVEESRLRMLTYDLIPWARSVFRESGSGNREIPDSFLRIYRDGAIGMAVQHGGVYTTTIARALNAQLAYFSWVWRKLGLRNPIEIELRLDGLAGAKMRTGDWQEQEVKEPAGVSVAEVILRRDQLPWDLD